MLDLAVAIPTLVGSIISMFAAGSIFFCYIALPPQRHFRHTLILNLAAADFVNALNNTTSGIYAISHRSIPQGVGCTLNGWVGQITVQATDFSVLFISIATVFTLRQFNYKPQSRKSTKFLLTLGIWFVPSCTSFTGLVLDDYRPVSGNWCWLSADSTVLRYALGHGWRLAIIFTIICLYTYLLVYMHRHFSSLRAIEDLNIDSGVDSSTEIGSAGNTDEAYVWSEFEVFHEFEDGYLRTEIPLDEGISYSPSMSDSKDISSIRQTSVSDAKDLELPLSPSSVMKQIIHPHRSEFTNAPPVSSFRHIGERSSLLTRDPLALIRRLPPTSINSGSSNEPFQRITVKAREFQIQKLLLLNAYPIAYILLLIPGILNRFAELSGHKSRVLGIAQSSTQFVGLANALVYGYNERIWSLALIWWKSKGRKTQTSGAETHPVEESIENAEHPEGWI